MQKPKKRIYIPDVHVGFLVLPVIAIIAILSNFFIPWVTALIDFLKNDLKPELSSLDKLGITGC